MDCDERFNSVHQVAVLQYKSETTSNYPEGPDPHYMRNREKGPVSDIQLFLFLT